MIGRIILVWLAASGLFLLGWCARSWLADDPESTHEDCQNTIGALSAALRREVANVHRLDRFVFAQLEYIEELKRDLADRGVTVASEFEQFLADREGGS